MKLNKWTIAGFSLVAVLLALKFIAPTQPIQMTEELQTALTETALASLKAEYNLLITGKSEGIELVPRHEGMTQQYHTGLERVASALRVREGSLKSGRRYTTVEVALRASGLEQRKGEVILHAVEETSEHFAFDDPSFRAQPNVTESRTEHDFIFAVERVSNIRRGSPFSIRVGAFEYVLIEDITEPQLVNYRSNALLLPDCASINARPGDAIDKRYQRNEFPFDIQEVSQCNLAEIRRRITYT